MRSSRDETEDKARGVAVDNSEESTLPSLFLFVEHVVFFLSAGAVPINSSLFNARETGKEQ
jgi:hypothetical protein